MTTPPEPLWKRWLDRLLMLNLLAVFLGAVVFAVAVLAQLQGNQALMDQIQQLWQPLFAPAIEPCWCEAQASGSPNAWFEQHAGEVADALLGVTDAQAARAKNQALATLYRSLRGMARPHVIAAVPRLPSVLAVVSPDQPVV